MMQKGVVQLCNREGELTFYRKLSERLPEFLNHYGPEKGYAVVTEVVDSLSLKPGLLRLYETAIQAGRKPEELGLPPAQAIGQTQVCRATLLDSSGRVVASATAAKHICGYKDLEVLETAARQRLLAALGFGGDMLDNDEYLDQTDQQLQPYSGRVPIKTPSVASTDREVAVITPAVVVDSVPTASACSTTAPLLADESPPQDHPIEGRVFSVDDPSTVSPAPEPSGLKMLRDQIAHLARMRAEQAPCVTTLDEARAVLKQMLQPPLKPT